MFGMREIAFHRQLEHDTSQKKPREWEIYRDDSYFSKFREALRLDPGNAQNSFLLAGNTIHIIRHQCGADSSGDRKINLLKETFTGRNKKIYDFDSICDVVREEHEKCLAGRIKNPGIGMNERNDQESYDDFSVGQKSWNAPNWDVLVAADGSDDKNRHLAMGHKHVFMKVVFLIICFLFDARFASFVFVSFHSKENIRFLISHDIMFFNTKGQTPQRLW